MLGFLRRGGRRSALGAAVTGIPSAPVAPPAAPVARPAVPVAPPVPSVPPPAAPLPVVPAVPGPRVELGFRDGSRTCLDPGSQEAQALDELARLLSGRS